MAQIINPATLNVIAEPRETPIEAIVARAQRATGTWQPRRRRERAAVKGRPA
jgi:acyl-CoA reductase-like NAD-dependent aldehyde dehydrogenase